MMPNVLNRMKNEVKKICNFYFSSYGWKYIENWPYLKYKNYHNSKNKYRKNLKHDFYFVSAQSASFMKIWPVLKKIVLMHVFWPMHDSKHWRKYLYAVEANLFPLGSTNPKKNRPSPCFFLAFVPGAYYRGLFVRGLFVGGLLTYNRFNIYLLRYLS